MAEAKPDKKVTATQANKKMLLGPYYIYFIFFLFGGSVLEDPFNDEIFGMITSTVKKLGDKTLNLNGHTDHAGSSEYNITLSHKRFWA